MDTLKLVLLDTLWEYQLHELFLKRLIYSNKIKNNIPRAKSATTIVVSTNVSAIARTIYSRCT